MLNSVVKGVNFTLVNWWNLADVGVRRSTNNASVTCLTLLDIQMKVVLSCRAMYRKGSTILLKRYATDRFPSLFANANANTRTSGVVSRLRPPFQTREFST